MSRAKQPANPFYVLLVVVGIVFSLTACLYGVVTVRALKSGPAAAAEGPSGSLEWLDRNAVAIFGVELAVLAACTIGAIALDTRRDTTRRPPVAPPNSPPKGHESAGH